MQNQSDQPRSKPSHRGTRHLRVDIDVDAKGARISSVWVADQPAVQMPHLVGQVFARMDLKGAPVLVQAFPDPRIARGAYRKREGHSYLRYPTGAITVSVPFGDILELSDLRIRVIDASKSKPTVHLPADVSSMFDNSDDSAPIIGDFNFHALRCHTSWEKAAHGLRLPTDVGRIEIYTTGEGGYRWRIRRMDGECIAESCHTNQTRTDCESDILWLRDHIHTMHVVPADMPDHCAQ